jgi:hypothetical protein
MAADIIDCENLVAHTCNADGFTVLLDAHRLSSLKR